MHKSDAYPVIHVHFSVHNLFIVRHDDVKTISCCTSDIFIDQ